MSDEERRAWAAEVVEAFRQAIGWPRALSATTCNPIATERDATGPDRTS